MNEFEAAVARYLVSNPKWGQEEKEVESPKDEESSTKITK